MADRTADCVADHFEEAFRTLRKLPPVKAQGYFNAWPEYRPDQPRDRGDGTPADAGLALGRARSPGSSRPRLGALDRGGRAQAGLVRANRKPWKQISGSWACDRTDRRWRMLASGADGKIACATECAVTPMCCNTFSFDICNMIVGYSEGKMGRVRWKARSPLCVTRERSAQALAAPLASGVQRGSSRGPNPPSL
jgi:hypothetical protein